MSISVVAAKAHAPNCDVCLHLCRLLANGPSGMRTRPASSGPSSTCLLDSRKTVHRRSRRSRRHSMRRPNCRCRESGRGRRGSSRRQYPCRSSRRSGHANCRALADGIRDCSWELKYSHEHVGPGWTRRHLSDTCWPSALARRVRRASCCHR